MRRREFLVLIGGMATVLPAGASAQQRGKVYRIGILEPTAAAQNTANLEALRLGLRNLGYAEGQNLILEYRSSDGRDERFPELAADLVRLKVDLIVTRGTPAAQAAKGASGSTPVVMAAMGAPLLVVPSLPHPSGNVTGMTTFSAELIGKRVELLKELIPALSRLALLHDMGNPMSPPEWQEAQDAARSLALQAILLDIRSEDDLPRAFEEAARARVDALLVGADGLTQAHQRTIVDFAARDRLPAIHPSRDFVELGGLMAYAPSYPDLYLRAASLIDKILRGANPADLPVEQPTRFELVINLKTANALGLTIPQTILVRADEVIE
ncbi:MAG TPA: ABC transporter substrate-binding protein [Stellaceae bacterium]|nr:ABC transporter substrate-binding protein [Stellaceae bacterium]